MPRQDEWTDDEIVLALAACPRERQSYGPTRHNVLELASLIGRTPGAVSLRFANISHLIHGRGHGKEHVSQRTRELYAQYTGKDDELHARANRIRRELTREDPLPRIEKEVDLQETVDRLLREVHARARELGIPQKEVDSYERRGSWIAGVVLLGGNYLFRHPEALEIFALWLVDRFGKRAKQSNGFALAIQGKRQEIADRILQRHAPELHAAELSGEDRVTVAIAIAETGSMHAWKLGPRHLRRLANLDRPAERARIRSALEIDPERLCDHCLLLLGDLLDKMGRRSTK
jgi:hypothetical protein